MITRAKAEEAHLVLLSFYMGEIAQLPTGFDQLDKHVLTALYNSAARSTHPDMGGKPEDFVRVDHAKHVLLRWLEKPAPAKAVKHAPRPCGNCDGKGFIQTMLGFKLGPRKQCQPCRGTGDDDFEPEEGEAH